MRIFSENYIVIDAGTKNVRAALFQAGATGHRLIDLATHPVGLTEEHGQLSEQIIAFLREKFPQVHNLVILIPSDRIYIRDIRLPLTRDSKIRDLLPFETENLLPVSLDEVVVVGHTWEKTEESSRSISFSITREFLSSTVIPFTTEEYFIKMISPDSAGIADAMHLADPAEYAESTTAQLHVSEGGTVLNILRNGILCFTRSFTPGGSELIEAVRTATGTDVESAMLILTELPFHLNDDAFVPSDVLLRSLQIKTSSYKQIRFEMKSIYREIALETERTLMSVPEFGGVSKIYLSGHPPMVEGVDQFLQGVLEIPVSGYPQEIFQASASSEWIPIMGAAIHYSRSSRSRTDFTRTPFGSHIRKSEVNFALFRLPAILSAASTVILLISFIMGMMIDRSAIKNADAEILKVAKRIPGVQTTGDPLTQAIALCKKRLGGGESGIRILDVLEKISQIFPAGTDVPFRIKKFHYTGTDAQFEAEMERLTDVSTVEKILSEEKSFLNVEVKSDLLSNKKVRVNVKIKLKKADIGEGIGNCG